MAKGKQPTKPKPSKFQHLLEQMAFEQSKKASQNRPNYPWNRPVEYEGRPARNKPRKKFKPPTERKWERRPKHSIHHGSRRIFWAAVDVLQISKDKVGTITLHRFPIKAAPLEMQRHFYTPTQNGVTCKTYSFKLFSVNLEDGGCRIFDEMTGTLLIEGKDLHAALSYVGNRIDKALTHPKRDALIEELAAKPEVHTLPEIDSKKALEILNGLNEKRIRRETKKINKEARIARLNQVSDLYTPRE